MKINHSKPYLGDRELSALSEVLRSAYLTNGPKAKELCLRTASSLGKRHALATQSGTAALTLALAALGVGKGAEIAVPAYICSAPLDALAALGLKPSPVDIDPDTLAMDVEKVSETAGRSAAAIAAHMFGVPAPFHKLRGIPLIEDCAQTLGVEIGGRPVGSLGEAAICSFYATKLLAAGHGGLVAFDDDAAFAEAVSITSHDKRGEWEPRMHVLMSDLNAALALAQLERLPAMIARRREIAARFADAAGVAADFSGSACSRFILFTVEKSSDELIAEFNAAGIEAKKPVYKPLYSYLGLDDERFPVAAEVHGRIISIPLYPALTETEIQFIEEFLAKHAGRLAAKFA